MSVSSNYIERRTRACTAQGAVLKRLRTDARLSQIGTARAANLDRGQLAALEHGRQQLTLTTLLALAPVLKVGPVELLDQIVRGIE